MATITLANQTLNESLSVGDRVYYATMTDVNDSQGNKVFEKLNSPSDIGSVTAINRVTSVITVSTTLSNVNLIGKFLLFSKNNAVETSGLKGYYATVKMKNTSTTASELYAVNSEIAESSK